MAEGLVEAIIAAGDDNITIARAKRLVGHDVGMPVPVALCFLPRDQIVGRDVAQQCDRRLQERNIDVLPLAGLVTHMQRRENRDAGEHPRRHIADGRADALRFTIDLPGDGHNPRLGLRYEVIAGPRGIRAILPGRKFSTSTVAFLMRASRRSFPSGVPKSRVMLYLLRLSPR